jgi:hypothetical protein
MGEALIVRRGGIISIPYYEITIDSSKIDSNLTDFPVMVKATSSDYDMSLLTDDNVYFTDMSDNLLDFEVEYGSSTERIYHVRIPTIGSSSNTQFKLKYDGSGYTNGNNATNVWDSNYLAVWHLGNNLIDSSGNGHNGSNSGTALVSGLNGQARSFNGNDYIDFTSFTMNSSQVTVTYIAKTDTFNNSTVYFIGEGISSTEQLMIHLGGGAGTNGVRWWNYNGGSQPLDNQSMLLQSYTCYTFINNNSNDLAYRNGSLFKTQGGGGGGSVTSGYSLGRRANGNQYHYLGDIDEFRISNIQRSAAWVKAEYHSLFNTLISTIEQK